MKGITAMVVVQIASAGLNILFKLSVEDGMNPRVLVAYRLFFATLFMFPMSFIFQRKKRPEFTWRLLLLALLSGILGMESVRLGSSEGKAKVVGTMLGVGGALVFIFYRGKAIHLWSTHVDLVNQTSDSTTHHISFFGALLVFGGNLSYSLWLLLQVKIGKKFGGPYWNATLMNMMGSIVAVILALSWNVDCKEWRLGWNIRLLTIAYAAIVISGMVVAVNAWCIESRGALFVSVFSPIGLVIVALVGSFVLNEILHLGSIVGTVIIVGGLYLVLWGKNKEMKSINPTTDHNETNKTSKDITLNNLPTLSTNVP
ncbi:unnamed protein product [Microthlaspi erraticum]|uniref:WAT1-related protein n=1 Tax=Microthlaspi erraticum TaxID=1685480 RepID=A0A6D2L1A1_9BRAS|nr:unnamed protein product [Microthlaspi erraticum]